MLKFYYNTGPNPMKVALFLEESGLAYEAVPLDTRKGEQHADVEGDLLRVRGRGRVPLGAAVRFEHHRAGGRRNHPRKPVAHAVGRRQFRPRDRQLKGRGADREALPRDGEPDVL